MTKYLIYVENEKKPLKKFKREYEAIDFASDFRNLADYGCMQVVMETDSDGCYVWDTQDAVWLKMEEQ